MGTPCAAADCVDLVVHIGNVARVNHLGIAALQHPLQQFKNNRRAGIADVGIVVDRRPAGIQRDPFRVERLEGFLACG